MKTLIESSCCVNSGLTSKNAQNPSFRVALAERVWEWKRRGEERLEAVCQDSAESILYGIDLLQFSRCIVIYAARNF